MVWTISRRYGVDKKEIILELSQMHVTYIMDDSYLTSQHDCPLSVAIVSNYTLYVMMKYMLRC